MEQAQKRPTKAVGQDQVVLLCRLPWKQVSFGAPATRTTLEQMTVV